MIFFCDCELQDGEGRALIPAENVEAIAQFVHQKSSLSLIHYFNESEETKGKEKAYDDVKVETERCVCNLHRDTGLLTIGVCSDVQGLQVNIPTLSFQIEYSSHDVDVDV